MTTLHIEKGPGNPLQNSRSHSVARMLSANTSNIKCAKHENLVKKLQCNEDDSFVPSEAIRVVEGSNDSYHRELSSRAYPKAQDHSLEDLG